MLRGYRSIVLAVGLILSGASQSPDESAARKKHQPAKQEKARPASVEPTPSTPAKAVEPLEYYEPCSQAKSKRNSDLCAQWSAANAARDAANWAWWQLWLSAAGVLGLIITITQSRAALSRARDANRIAQTVAENSIRPHLFPHFVEIYEIDERKIQVQILLRNFGAGVARKPNLYVTQYVADMPFKRLKHFIFERLLLPDTAPGAEHRIYRYFDLTDPERQSLGDYETNLVIRFRYSYLDDNGVRSDERYSYTGVGPIKAGQKLGLFSGADVMKMRDIIRESAERQPTFLNDMEGEDYQEI
jgi:hypothetical protein